MVTLIGVGWLITGIILLVCYDVTLSKVLPNWIYLYFAFTAFLAQTFDAIDGKHARNTKRSSPLGQLMDHGCDSFSNSFQIIMLAQAHRLAHSFDTILIQATLQVNNRLIIFDYSLAFTYGNGMNIKQEY
jgi:phosphatidylglycerophosphate synthase